MPKILLLAAGSGERYKRDILGPKCLTYFDGVRLIDYQLQLFKDFGIKEIAIVTGFMPETISDIGVPAYHNDEFRNTNMVTTIYKAIDFFDYKDDIIITYTDIIYEPKILSSLIASTGDFVIVADRNWETLWQLRMTDYMSDIESLLTDDSNRITDIGSNSPPKDKVAGQYIGLIKLTPIAQKNFVIALNKAFSSYSSTVSSPYAQYSLTQLISELVQHDWEINVCWVNGGWLEFDTENDRISYEENKNSEEFKGIFNRGWYCN